MGIRIENVTKRFGDFQALEPINLEVKSGSLVALLGPSGSGKSTLLRVIAGLESADTGRIYISAQDATHRSVQDRQIGFVFQHYALFKHLTVRKNIAFALDLQKWPQERIKNRVDTLLDLVQLSHLGDRYPSQLSGGQRQRVALARALAIEPQVLLLDEPFGALDAKVRKDLRDWLRHLHDDVHVTTVFVTHDQEEAMEIADEIVVMSNGKIEQVGTPEEIYENPATPFVMSFIGAVNVLSPDDTWKAHHRDVPQHASQVFLRPHDIEIFAAPTDGTLSATINYIIHLGWTIRLELTLDNGQPVTAHINREQYKALDIQQGQRVYLRAKLIRSFTDTPSYSPSVA
ncbi:sulfate/molybdate ABC transporter ATP-binding protein [Nodosilinea sp. PGN35]|uniref:sulfate/molybdate ABC transporter ATP-binding protein n=1 Tax=Nodosilinea sp. PGN35 TaxID=3020489 RepID=UPI0023B22880|nr:sulfate/molybdate ABC transporter ATP-binding protein [Nodosilinea sp. TSF1-S3]